MAAYRGSRLKFIGAALVAGLAMTTQASNAAATSPTLAWSGAKRLNILCNVAGGPGIDHAALAAQLCGEVKRLAGQRAPLPVAVIDLGDPAVLSSDAVTLLVHASIARHGRDRLLAFSIRPYRVSDTQASVLFGAAPRAVAFQGKSVSGAAVAAAVDAALSEVLPWRSAPRI